MCVNLYMFKTNYVLAILMPVDHCDFSPTFSALSIRQLPQRFRFGRLHRLCFRGGLQDIL